MRRLLSLVLAVLLATGGCASYTPTSAPVPDPAAMVARGTAGDVSVAADPWVDRERQKAVFDADFHDKRVLAVHVHAKNGGSRRLLVRKSDMALLLPAGRQLAPASASAVAAKLEGTGDVIAWSLAFGIIGFLAASSADDKARAARLQDYRQKEFQDATLGRDVAAHGFVYFIPPRGTPPFEQARLAVRFVDLEDVKSTVVELPLARLGYRGWTDDDAEQARQEPRRGAVVGAATPSPPTAGASGELAALVGNWVGTLTLARRAAVETDLTHEVDVRIFEEGGGVRWEFLVPAQGRGRGGSGWVRVGADGVSLSGAYAPDAFSTGGSAFRPLAGQAASVAITYVLSPGGGGLEGSGVGADNRVQRLTLRRAP